MSTITYQAIVESLSEIKANQLNEDGHTDVPSSIRMCKTIMEDAHDILCALCNTDMDEEIDTWWTNKLAVSASTLNKLRDYYVHEVDHQEQPDEADMEIEEAKTDKAMGGSAGMGAPVKRGTGPAVYNTEKSYNPFEGMGKSKGLGTTTFAGGSGLAAALGATAAQQRQQTKNRNVPQDGRRRPGIQEEAIEENVFVDVARGLGRQLMHRGGPDTKPSPSTTGKLRGVFGPYLQKPVQRFLYPRERGMPPAARRQASMRTEDLEENIDIDFSDVANKYGKYAIPAGAALGAHMLLGKKREPIRNAVVAGAAGVGAEAAKRYYMSKNPGATSPYLQPAKIPEFKPTTQG